MKRILIALLVGGLYPFFGEAAGDPLWSIGTIDKSDAEFAGSKSEIQVVGDIASSANVVYMVGLSMPSGWLNMQPGPADAWASNKEHCCVVLFDLQTGFPNTDDCTLVLHLKNNHKEIPPRLQIRLNGQDVTEVQLQPGPGDDLMQGKTSEIPDIHVPIKIPGSMLDKKNVLEINNIQGSWLVYDAVEFFAPTSVKLAFPGNTPKDEKTDGTTVLIKASGQGVLLESDENPKYYRLPVVLDIGHIGGEINADFYFNNTFVEARKLENGGHQFAVNIPVKKGQKKGRPLSGTLSIRDGKKVILEKSLTVEMPKLEKFYLFPHSHVDIGYTHLQSEVINLQIDNMNVSLDLIEKSKDNTDGSKFRWNPESLWVWDHYLSQESSANQQKLREAVNSGDVSLDGLYGNLLTGLCRPEELQRGVGYFAQKAAAWSGKPIISAAICDVPGYTWGTIAMMGQAGIRYFAIAPNFSDRIGSIHDKWNDKPFYWLSQSGEEKVLCWVTAHYWLHGDLEQQILKRLQMRQNSSYPYRLEWMYWIATRNNGDCDNSPPDTKMSEAVQSWNKRYAMPKLQISTASEFFPIFEEKYGKLLPTYQGDMTPYWEDGAGSTSAETGMNRASADKLSQAETLWAMLNFEERPASVFEEAWKNTLLYSEHTWGAYCSISQPDSDFTKGQWTRKRQFALDAAKQSEKLLHPQEMLDTDTTAPFNSSNSFTVVNTSQWERTDVVVVPDEVAKIGDCVWQLGETKEDARLIPTQRLQNGSLVCLVKNVPPFSAVELGVVTGEPMLLSESEGVSVQDNCLKSQKVFVAINKDSGSIDNLQIPGLDHNFVDKNSAVGLNDYIYLKGVNPADAKTNGAVEITIGERGPLVASLIIKSKAPGCVDLTRELRLKYGSGQVECIDAVNRELVREKDAVHFGFGFNVPNGQLRMETPWAVVRPNKDQLPASCNNWFSVQRWVDISNDKLGILWAPLDAPLMEIGGLTANLLGSVALESWMTEANESTTIYSWAQNNHWHTNYKAEQPGVTTFRYVIAPHTSGYSSSDAMQFGHCTTRPLLVYRALNDATWTKLLAFRNQQPKGLLSIDKPFVIETLKVSEDGKAWIYRVQNTEDKLNTLLLGGKGIYTTDLSEQPITPAKGKIKVRPHGIINLRVPAKI